MARGRTSSCQIAAVALLASLVVSCKSGTDHVGQQVEWAKRMTVPVASELVSQTGPSTGEWSVTASWEIRTDWDKEKYSAWVASQLGPGFALMEKGEGLGNGLGLAHYQGLLLLAKYSDGETQELQFQMTPENSKLLVLVTLKVYPD